MKAVGARHLARKDSRVLGHADARGTAFLPDSLSELGVHPELAKPRACLVPYGTVSAVSPDLLDVTDEVVVDDWQEAQSGRLGALRHHVDTGLLPGETLYAELCAIMCGEKPCCATEDERILFWPRGLSILDLALGCLIVEGALRADVGANLCFQ